MRILIGFLVITFLCMTIGFAYWLNGSSDFINQKVQTFLSYSLSAVWTVQGLVTIFIAASSVSRDLKNKEIYTIATKPISRGQYLAGKFIGVMLMNLVLLLVNGAAIYGLAKGLQHFADKDDLGRFKLKELVLVARKVVKPPVPDVSESVRQKVEKIVEQKKNEEPVYRVDSALTQAMRLSLTKEIKKQEILRRRTVAPGSYITWHFQDIHPVDRENGILFIRYKHDVSIMPPDTKVVSGWAYGPADPIATGGTQVVTSDVVRTIHELAIPASELSSDGQLYVTYRNLIQNQPVSVIFPIDSGLEVLYVAGGFEANYLRSILLMFLKLVFLSILGIALGAWLSFPVAVLALLVIFLLGISSSFINETMKWEAKETGQAITKWLLIILPQLSVYDPVPYIEKGQYLSWGLVGRCVVFMVAIKGGIVAGFGYLVYKFRELARIIV